MNESVEETSQKNIDVTLNRAKDYYEHNKERLRMQARDKYKNLSPEEKNETNIYIYIQRERDRERERQRQRQREETDIIMSEEKKQKLKEYQKNYCEVKKSQFNR